ncbi:MAG TPA: GxGYxYP domain-containing protein [Bacteroidota bacterium]|nr:GxGYxYP domain-containing protein [Bacteroidota bacterium]
MKQSFLILCLFLFVTAQSALAQLDPSFIGSWKYIPEKSTEIDLYGSVSLEVKQLGSGARLVQTWGAGNSYRDTIELNDLSGRTTMHENISSRVFPTNVFMGLSMIVGEQREFTSTYDKKTRTLTIDERMPLRASQGATNVRTISTYNVSDDKQFLTLTIARSTRKESKPLVFTFARSESKQAYSMKLADNWETTGKLPQNAFLISLQGLANSGGARLYFEYPEKWDFLFTPSVLDFYKKKHHFSFTELKSADEALNALKTFVKGYVVWDKSIRQSLVVAFTIAGLEQSVVVTEEMIPMCEKAGLKMTGDLRGQFTGKKDVEIFTWAYEKYFDRCNRDFVVWLGGEEGKVMKPGVADFGIMKRAFFTDLSTKPADSAEYALSKKIMSGQNKMSLVMGWHSYAKDKERDYVTLASGNTLRVEGLHTLPNLSFSSQTTTTPGFTFRNNHQAEPGKTYTPKKKVYIAAIETDCLGLGSWLKPGRGALPYAWEVTMNWVWLAPSMLEYFYSMATPNDYFIGSLGGPGYMYPKAIPKQDLPMVVAKARELMQQLDLNVFEIMDYSEGATVEGNSDLTRDVTDAFFDGMPDAVGFVNGYAPSSTFTAKNGRALVSYDYYLSEKRSEDDAVADLKELMNINAARPYFLLMHVREWTDLVRVKSILDKLGPDAEVVPLDIFLKMAGARPTFKERFREIDRGASQGVNPLFN